MSRSPANLQFRIETLAAIFAREVVGALRTVPLSEIAHLSGAVITPSEPPAQRKRPVGQVVTPARKVANYPKCAWAGCGKNRSPRTLPYCGEHFRAVKAGATPPAGSLSMSEAVAMPGRRRSRLRVVKGGTKRS